MSLIYGTSEFFTELKRARSLSDKILAVEKEIAQLGEEVSRLMIEYEDTLRGLNLLPPMIDVEGGGHYLRRTDEQTPA